MNLLLQIQKELISDSKELSPALFKLRLLASSLGSDVLEDWVKYELEGYPVGIDVPDYRKIPITYTGSFVNRVHGISNAQIPSLVMQQCVGEEFVNFSLRDSVASVDKMSSGHEEGRNFYIDTANLIPLLHDKVYSGCSCTGVQGKFSSLAAKEVQNAVRNKVLELTIQLKKEVPEIVDINLSEMDGLESDAIMVTKITNNIVYGDMSNVENSGTMTGVSINISSGNVSDLKAHLLKNGLPDDEVAELVAIVEVEKPDGEDGPFGPKARKWLDKLLSKGAKGLGNIGVSTATSILTAALMKFYGLD